MHCVWAFETESNIWQKCVVVRVIGFKSVLSVFWVLQSSTKSKIQYILDSVFGLHI